MSDFFEKLKKGMDSNEVTSVEDDVLEVEPVAEFTSTAIDPEPMEDTPKPKAKKKATKKKPKPKVEKIEIEEIEEIKESPKESSGLFEEGPIGELTVDVYQEGKDLIIRSAIGGIESEDLDIVIENDFVVIKGSRDNTFKEEAKEYFFQECHWGSFKREIALPVEVDSSRSKAKLEKGILVIRMPIIEKKAKTKVSIE